jgi:hypothetical protein
MYLPKGICYVYEFHTEQEYKDYCLEMKNIHGNPIFEIPIPGIKVFTVYRDKDDNQIEVQYKPKTIGNVV